MTPRNSLVMSLRTRPGLQAGRPAPQCRLRSVWLQNQCSYLSISRTINHSLCTEHQSGCHRKAREGCHPGHAVKLSPVCRHKHSDWVDMESQGRRHSRCVYTASGKPLPKGASTHKWHDLLDHLHDLGETTPREGLPSPGLGQYMPTSLTPSWWATPLYTH